MDSPRIAACTREAARLLRRGGSPVDVLAALRCCPLTAPQLAWVFRARYHARTVYGALARLRLAGLAVGLGRVRRWPGGWATLWRCN